MSFGTRELVLLADLDGTLITPSAALGPGLRALVAELGRRNGVLVPVTARAIDNVARVFSGVPEVHLVVASGGAVTGCVAGGRVAAVLREEALTLSAGAAFVAALRATAQAGGGVYFEFGDWSRRFTVAIVGGDQLTRGELAMLVGARPVDHEYDGRDTGLVEPGRQVLGVSFLGRAKPADSERALPEGLDDIVSEVPAGWRWTAYPEVRLPGWQWLEVFSERAAKGPAADWVIATLAGGARSPAVLAVGDSVDDVPLFARATNSWCPMAAPAEVQAAAHEVLEVPGGEDFAAALAHRIRELDLD